MFKNKRRNAGFTLSEVLITLGIIGVIASLTIPQIINYSTKLQSEAILKQDISILSNAIDSLNNDYQDIATNTFMNYMIYSSGEIGLVNGQEFPLLMLSKYLPSKTNYCVGHNVFYGSWPKPSQIQLNSPINGICWGNDDKINTLNGMGGYPGGSAFNMFDTTNVPAAILPNGSFIRIRAATLLNAQIFIDTNGLKGPSTFGKDIFILMIVPASSTDNSAKLKPFDANPDISYNGSGANPSTTCVDNSSSAANTGLGCAMKIVLGNY